MKVTLHSHHTPSLLLSNEVGSTPDRTTSEFRPIRVVSSVDTTGLYTHFRSSSLREKASRNHLMCPAAAVVPT